MFHEVAIGEKAFYSLGSGVGASGRGTRLLPCVTREFVIP
jgi:hypothetical protein